MSNDFTKPTESRVVLATIDGKDVIGMFQSIAIYENIYSPIITGSIVLLDSDGNGFLEPDGDEMIEGSEEIEFEFTNANDESIQFKGDLNGLRNKQIKNQKSIYTFDFTSKQVRKNELTFITKKFDNKEPKEVIKEMIEKLDGEEDKINGSGLPLSFLGSRRRPTAIIEYCLTHGVTQNSSSTDEGKSQSEESRGTTGFACWQTLDGYRFSSIDEILKGDAGNDAGKFFHKPQNNQISLKDSMDTIIDYDFKVLGDIQSKLRSGAFKNVNISFDMDSGLYKEMVYNDEKNMTEKQKEISKFPTRYMWKPYVPEAFENSCEKAPANHWDQSRRYLSQNTVRQNTFADQFGTFTLPPRYKIRAGDKVEMIIPKVESEKGSGYNEKHTGNYIIKQVGHHFLGDGRSYTKIETVRSTIQQDDTTSSKS